MPLTSRQQTALAQLVEVGTVADAAKLARVTERTVFRWLQLPVFRARLTELQNEVLTQALHKLQGGAGKAADALIGNLNNKNKWVVHAAAVAILTNALKAREWLESSKRIEHIENQLLLLQPGRTQWRA